MESQGFEPSIRAQVLHHLCVHGMGGGHVTQIYYKWGESVSIYRGSDRIKQIYVLPNDECNPLCTGGT